MPRGGGEFVEIEADGQLHLLACQRHRLRPLVGGVLDSPQQFEDQRHVAGLRITGGDEDGVAPSLDRPGARHRMRRAEHVAEGIWVAIDC